MPVQWYAEAVGATRFSIKKNPGNGRPIHVTPSRTHGTAISSAPTHVATAHQRAAIHAHIPRVGIVHGAVRSDAGSTSFRGTPPPVPAGTTTVSANGGSRSSPGGAAAGASAISWAQSSRSASSASALG